MRLPKVLIHIIFSYYNCIINEYNITYGILKKSIQLNKIYYLVTKSSIYKKYFINAKTIANYISEYYAYQKEYEYNLGLPWFVMENPILIDILFTNYNLPHTFSSYLYLSDSKIEKDIKNILNILPKCVNSAYGKVRCRTNISPLYAACINENIQLYIIEILLQYGANIHQPILIFEKQYHILTDLRYNISSTRYNKIKQLFQKYNKNNLKINNNYE